MAIATNTERLQQVLTEALMDEFEAQGHAMSGKLIKDIEYVVKQEVDKISISGLMYMYGNILASGTKSSKIPFSGRTGRGGTSLYIQALQNYAKQRMNIQDEKKSLSVAFAIAHEQKKHGMPTPGSYKHSSTGKRTEFIEDAFKRGEDKISEAVSDMAFNLLTVKIDVLMKKWEFELNQ
jgi:hypothetical protein